MIRQIVVGYPTFFNLSIDNLRLKISFFSKDLKGTLEALSNTLIGTPTILGYSLTKRLRPRLQVVRSLDVDPTFTDHCWLLTSYTDLQFRKWVERKIIEKLNANGRGDPEVRNMMRECTTMLRTTQRTTQRY